MSLASAQAALARANRKNLQQSAKGKIGSGMIEFAGDLVSELVPLADEALGISENVQAWDDYESGQDYLGIGKEGMNKPKSLWQKMTKRPDDIYKDPIAVGGKKTYRPHEITGIGSLASSDQRVLYEDMMGGDLSSRVGTPMSALPDPEPPGDDMALSLQDTVSEHKDKFGGMDWSPKTGLSTGKSLLSQTSSGERTYKQFETPDGGSDMAPVTDANQSFKDKGLKHGGLGLGSREGNIAIAKALNKKGIKGTSLSQMIPGYRDMEYDEKMEAIQSLGVGPEEMFGELLGSPKPLKMRF